MQQKTDQTEWHEFKRKLHTRRWRGSDNRYDHHKNENTRGRRCDRLVVFYHSPEKECKLLRTGSAPSDDATSTDLILEVDAAAVAGADDVEGPASKINPTTVADKRVPGSGCLRKENKMRTLHPSDEHCVCAARRSSEDTETVSAMIVRWPTRARAHNFCTAQRTMDDSVADHSKIQLMGNEPTSQQLMSDGPFHLTLPTFNSVFPTDYIILYYSSNIVNNLKPYCPLNAHPRSAVECRSVLAFRWTH